MTSYNGFENTGFAGTPLAEVSSVIINTGDAEECKLYGTVEVTDCNGTLLVYDIKQEDPETVKQNGSLCLTNHERAISGYDHFTVRFNLKDKNGDVFINNSFVWNEGMGYDKFLSADVLGEHASVKATVYYTVYELAIEASIWVKFTEDDSASSDSASSCDIVNASGSVIARYKERYDWPKAKFQKKYHEITLFECGSFELEDEGLVQQSRSVVVVSLFHSLTIAVDLKSSEGDELWSGEVEFVPNSIVLNRGCVEIKGRYGVLEVYALGFRYIESFKDVNGWKTGFRKSGYLPFIKRTDIF